jgi:hypothetical protein
MLNGVIGEEMSQCRFPQQIPVWIVVATNMALRDKKLENTVLNCGGRL